MAKDPIEKVMERFGWHKEVHHILGKKQIRYHKEGFELSEADAIELLFAGH